MNPMKLAIFKEIREVVPALSPLSDDELNVKMFMHLDTLRLSYPGVLLLAKIFTAYQFPVPVTLKAKHQIGLSKLDYPYYISHNRLVVFSDSDAMVIKLTGGIELFLENNFLIDR